MEDRTFARILSSWLPPSVIAQAAEEIADDPHSGAELGQLFILSNKFSDAREVGFDQLATRFLDNFHIPSELVSLARFYRPSLPIEIWTQVRELEFSGQVSFKASTKEGRWLIAATTAPITQLRLIQWPLQALADVVGDLATYWRTVRLRAGPRAVHHEHVAEWPFLASIDAIVAQAHGFPMVGTAGMSQRNNLDYEVASTGRFCSVRADLPISAERLTAIGAIGELISRPFPEIFERSNEDD